MGGCTKGWGQEGVDAGPGGGRCRVQVGMGGGGCRTEWNEVGAREGEWSVGINY